VLAAGLALHHLREECNEEGGAVERRIYVFILNTKEMDGLIKVNKNTFKWL